MNLAKRANGDLAKYDPGKGLLRIDYLEMAEKRFAKAKDATKLHAAIEGKLQAQAEFVAWWDTQVQKAIGGDKRSEKHRNGSVTVIAAGKNGLPDRTTIHRWRRRLSTDESFAATLEAALSRYVKVLEFHSGNTRGVGLSLAEEWYTPSKYLDAAREVLGGIDLDPASSASANKRVKARKFLSASDNGLKHDWPGRVWLNPPYVGAAGPFSERLVEQFKVGITTAAVLLVNAHSTDTAWFQPLWDFALCFTDHRINFIAGNGQEQSGSNHGSVLIYLGPKRKQFIDRFSEFGAVVERRCSASDVQAFVLGWFEWANAQKAEVA